MSPEREQHEIVYKKQARLDIRKYTFGMRVVDSWNKLPDDVITAESTQTFKEKLDYWMLRHRH